MYKVKCWSCKNEFDLDNHRDEGVRKNYFGNMYVVCTCSKECEDKEYERLTKYKNPPVRHLMSNNP